MWLIFRLIIEFLKAGITLRTVKLHYLMQSFTELFTETGFRLTEE